VLSVSSTVSVNAGESVSVSASATDADNDPLSFSWTADSALTVSGENSNTLVITAPSVTADTQYTVAVSVSDGEASVSRNVTVNVIAPTTGENQAPVVAAIADKTVAEDASVDVAVSASDADGDALSYSWTVPAGLTLAGSGADVSLQAGSVDADTSYVVSVSVSDGQTATAVSFNVTVTDSGTTTPPDGETTWDAAATYVGGDTVIYNGVEYTAKWWTQGERPDLGGPWEATSQPTDGNGDVVWQAAGIYNGGDQVIYQGNKYEAKWWTQGDEPGVADVWKAL